MADFHAYPSFWEATKPHEPGRSPHRFYSELCREHLQERHTAQYRHALAEQRWIDHGCPFYRMHEDAIHLLRNVSIDIPFRYVRAPFDAFAVDFPLPNTLAVAGGRYVRSMLVSLLGDKSGAPCFTLVIDTGEVTPIPPHIPLMHGISLEARPDEEIGAKIDRMEASPGSDQCFLAGGMDRVCVRLAVSVCFLARHDGTRTWRIGSASTCRSAERRGRRSRPPLTIGRAALC